MPIGNRHSTTLRQGSGPDVRELQRRSPTAAPRPHAVRAAIRRSQAPIQEFAQQHGLSRKTARRRRGRDVVHAAAMGPKAPRSRVLTPETEAMAVAFRRQTLPPLDDGLCAAGDEPALDPLSLAPRLPPARDWAAARDRGWRALELGRPARPSPHGHRQRVPWAGRAALLRGRRPHVEARLRPVGAASPPRHDRNARTFLSASLSPPPSAFGQVIEIIDLGASPDQVIDSKKQIENHGATGAKEAQMEGVY